MDLKKLEQLTEILRAKARIEELLDSPKGNNPFFMKFTDDDTVLFIPISDQAGDEWRKAKVTFTNKYLKLLDKEILRLKLELGIK